MHYVDFEKAFDSMHRESLLEDDESDKKHVRVLSVPL